MSDKQTVALKFKPYDVQQQIIDDPHRFKVVAAGRRLGKALDITTPILTTKGWKTLNDIVVGDIIFNELGKQTKVLYTSEIYYNRKCYKVKFSDGSEIVADASHDWVVEDKCYRKNKARSPVNTSSTLRKLTTEQLAAQVKYGKKQESNWSIPVCGQLEFRKKKQLIDPYVLGMWLGDGHSRGGIITTNDPEIFEYFPPDLKAYKKKQKYQYRIENLQVRLRKLGLLNNKHIPNNYMFGSVEQRLALLQGFMDSDGTACSRGGNLEFCNCNKKLAFQTYDLVVSLGIKATITESDAKLHGRVVNRKFRLQFSSSLPVFRLKRKLARLKDIHKSDIKRRFIKEIVEVDSVPVKCLMVDSPSHLFLAGKSLIATHNTCLAINYLIREVLLKPGKYYYIAPTIRQAKEIAWDVLKQYAPEELVKTYNENDLRIRFINGGTIRLLGADNEESLRGSALHGVVMDEMADIKPHVWQRIIRPMLADHRGWALFIGSPKGHNHFYEHFIRCQENSDEDYRNENNKQIEIDPDYRSWQLKTSANPYIPKDEIEKARQELSEENFRQEFEASFENYSGVIYKEYKPDIHNILCPKVEPHWRVYVGIDTGRHTAISFVALNGKNEAYVFDEIYDYDSTVAEICHLLRQKLTNHDIAITRPVFIIDSASQSKREYKHNGIFVVDSKKDVLNSIEVIRRRFKSETLFFDETKCPAHISEHKGYRWEDRLYGKSRLPKPIKESDHAVNALQYVLNSPYVVSGLTDTEIAYNQQLKRMRDFDKMSFADSDYEAIEDELARINTQRGKPLATETRDDGIKYDRSGITGY